MHFLTEPLLFPKPLEKALLQSFGKNFNSVLLGKNLSELWPVLAKGRGQESRHYSFNENFARTYAAYYLPANAMKLSLVLEEMHRMGLPLLQPCRWLDLGTGPGTAFWGLAWWLHVCATDGTFQTDTDSHVEFWGLEQSLHFVKLASELSDSLLTNLNGSIKTHWELFKHSGDGRGSGERLRQSAKSSIHWIRTVQPHVVSFMNSISEMVPHLKDRTEWIVNIVKELTACAKADQKPRWLILIEPGSKDASRELLLLREILRKHPEIKIWLPCLNNRPCGALEKKEDWCHEEAACDFPDWFHDLGTKAGLKKELLLFSYLVCSVGVHPEMPLPWPSTGMRVVSQRLEEKGFSQCYLCTESGKKRMRVLHSKTTEKNQMLHEALRGQIFDYVQSDEKRNVIDLKVHY